MNKADILEIIDNELDTYIPQSIQEKEFKKGMQFARNLIDMQEDAGVPVYNRGFRCPVCDIQFNNPSMSRICYCHKCGRGYDCGDLWRRLRREYESRM